MSAPGDLDQGMRRSRTVRRIRKTARRWRRRIAVELGLVPPPADRGYMICATARSGSGYLSRLLASTGVLGNPREYFNAAGWRRFDDPNYPSNPRKQLRIVMSTGATANRIYGVKVLASQLRVFGDRIDPFRELPNLELLRLRRKDVLGQAVSLARATQTSQFAAYHPERRPPAYDQGKIRRCLLGLTHQELLWDRIVERLGAAPLTFEYETFVLNPQDTVERVALLMGVALPVSINWALIRHVVQRDELNTEWRQRFLAETGDEFKHLGIS